MKFDVEVKQASDGSPEVLVPQNIATELGIDKHLQRGPIEFGSGKQRVTLRGAGDNAGFNEPARG